MRKHRAQQIAHFLPAVRRADGPEAFQQPPGGEIFRVDRGGDSHKPQPAPAFGQQLPDGGGHQALPGGGPCQLIAQFGGGARRALFHPGEVQIAEDLLLPRPAEIPVEGRPGGIFGASSRRYRRCRSGV